MAVATCVLRRSPRAPPCSAPAPRSMFAAVDPTTVDPQEAISRERLQRAVGVRYEVGRLVGRGGFADVFEAHEPRLARRVAIKAVRPDAGVSAELIERFQREARAMAGLRHPHVMEIYTVGESDEVAYFVMPLVDGESLKGRIAREGALPLEETVRILGEAASALDAAHRAGTVHRDVKPDNIMLEGDAGRVLITDFGIAKALGGDTSSYTTSGFVGTPRYMSPEQATGEEADHRADIYSLGVVAFEMVVGRPPFEAKSVQAMIAKHLTEDPPPLRFLRPDCPERLARVVAKCLAKDPGDRWSSLAEAVAVLEGEDDPSAEVALAATGPTPTALKQVRSLRRTAGVTFGLLFVLLALDQALGLGGWSPWLLAGAIGYFALRAGRLWRDGYEWRELLLGASGGSPSAGGMPMAASGESEGDDFGRFSSLVRTTVSDRAAIMKALAAMTHQEQNRLRGLQPAVDGLGARARHLARRVVNLESRIAEVTSRMEPTGDEAPAGGQERQVARLHELDAARDDAARELHACLHRLEELREGVCDVVLEVAPDGLDVIARTLSETEAYLSRRAV